MDSSDSDEDSAPQFLAIYWARSRPRYECRVCGSYFYREKYWFYHTQRHYGHGVFRCQSCPVVRSTLTEVYAHEANVHGPMPVTWTDLQANTVTAAELEEEDDEEYDYSGDSSSMDEENDSEDPCSDQLELEDKVDEEEPICPPPSPQPPHDETDSSNQQSTSSVPVPDDDSPKRKRRKQSAAEIPPEIGHSEIEKMDLPMDQIMTKEMVEKALECVVCHKKSTKLGDISACLRDHGVHRCCICFNTYLDKENYNQHMKKCHFSSGKPKCPVCDKSFSKTGQLAGHVNILHFIPLLLQSKNNSRNESEKVEKNADGVDGEEDAEALIKEEVTEEDQKGEDDHVFQNDNDDGNGNRNVKVEVEEPLDL